MSLIKNIVNYRTLMINIFRRNLLKKNIFVFKQRNCSTGVTNATKENCSDQTRSTVSNKILTGIFSVTTLSNVVYSVMRAKGRGKNNNSDPNDECVRTLSFLFGFPFSMLPYMCIKEGSNKILGLKLDFMD